MLKSVLITGANRGIGLEFVRQFTSLSPPPRFVFASFRNDDTVQDLEEVKNSAKNCQVILLKMDVRFPEQVEESRKIVEAHVCNDGLNLLINNAGVALNDNFPEYNLEDLRHHFETNTAGPLTVLKEMLPLLQKSADFHLGSGLSISRAAVVNISSAGGSLARATSKQNHQWTVLSYRISKVTLLQEAALNMAMRVLSVDLCDRGILVIEMCPGWVSGTGEPPEKIRRNIFESVSRIIQTIGRLNETHQGEFMENDGRSIPL